MKASDARLTSRFVVLPARWGRRVAAAVVGGRVAAVVLGGAVLGAGTLASGCGASIQAIYEGDIRFEHCMALDAQPQIAASDRRACWTEWVTHYTYGQTRDRVLHAQLRIQQLGDSGDVVKSSAVLSPNTAPLPQLSKSLLEQREDFAPVHACHAECRVVNEACLDGCDASTQRSGCKPGCEAGLRQCTQQCR